MEVSGQLHAPVALPPGKELVVPNWIGGGPQSLSEGGGEKKNSQSLPWLRYFIMPIHI